MVLRELGNTGIKVSEIGIGCEGLTGKDEAFARRMLDIMEEKGANTIDLYSPDPHVRSLFGAALKDRREKFVLQAHFCTVWEDGQYCVSRDIDKVKESFEDALFRLGTDYVEIGMIHYVDSPETWSEIASGEVMEYAKKLKTEGVIKSIGLSSHNPIAAAEAVKSGLIDVLMFSVNPCYDLLPGGEDCEQLWADESYESELTNMDPERAALYELCQRKGVGITVMKVFGGGDLLTEESPALKALTPEQCIHYALTRPAVSSVLVGAHSYEELEASLAYEDASEDERDFARAFAELPRISWSGHCMYCGHCAPCPAGISVADVTKFLNLAKAQGEVPETVREHYKALHHTAGECIECGACEERCPFEVNVIENMRKAKKIFGK